MCMSSVSLSLQFNFLLRNTEKYISAVHCEPEQIVCFVFLDGELFEAENEDLQQ